MEKCDYSTPWYHGSPEQLAVLSTGSWITQSREIAKAFSHKPTLMSISDDGENIKHNGQKPGFLYMVSEPIGPNDVSYLRDTARTHWQTQRDFQVRLIAELPVDDPPLLSQVEIIEMRKKVPESTTAFIGDRDEDRTNPTERALAADEDKPRR